METIINTTSINEVVFTINGQAFTMSRMNENDNWSLYMGQGRPQDLRIVIDDSACEDYYCDAETALSIFSDYIKQFIVTSLEVKENADGCPIVWVSAECNETAVELPSDEVCPGELTFALALAQTGVIVPEAMIDEIDERHEPYRDAYLASLEK